MSVTQCETCFNASCTDRGTRNIHWDGKRNYCSRWKDDPDKTVPPKQRTFEDFQREVQEKMKDFHLY